MPFGAGDGYADLLAVTRRGVFAWRQQPRPGALPFAFLMALLLLGAGLAYAAEEGGGARGSRGGGRSSKRSTDVE